MKMTMPLIAAAVAVVVAVGGCAATAPNNPVEMLKWSMTKYQGMKAFHSTCTWGFSSEPAHATRSLDYATPNKWKVVSKTTNGFTQTSVCDGKQVLETTNMKTLQPMTFPAPASISGATSMDMQHPMFCGTLLYQFFGGPSNLDKLRDAKKPVTFGQTVTIAGSKCREVKFYAMGTYGNVTAAIDLSTGLVRRIVYDSEGLKKMMSKELAGQSLISTELYQGIVVDKPVAASLFAVNPPKVPESESPDALAGKYVGKPAPDFTVTGMDGKTVALSSLKGQVVLVDFWATWCPPCRRGMPENQKLFDEYGGKGLTMLAISNENKETVSKFVQENKLTLPTYLDGDRQASKAYGVTGIPTTVIIDKDGKVSALFVGLQDPDKIRDALKQAGLTL